ncbi:MAG: acetolactate synthase small subunit [Anaerolineaceae bacterium]|nr:acetolactate synthase small subunit [Anaerolineaceae bacterium]
MQHILVALVEDKPGVLTRVASMFRRRALNIKSLTVGHTETPGISRMTILVDYGKDEVRKVTANLYKMVNVIEVHDLTKTRYVSRNLAMIKVATNAQSRSEIMQLVDIYRGRIVDTSTNSLIVELTGSEEKIDSFVDVLRPYGIIEMVRTDIVAMTRGDNPLHPDNSNGRKKEKEFQTSEYKMMSVAAD